MSLPGPPGALWAVALVLWALAVAVVGEVVRGVAARWVTGWRVLEPIERGLLDLYLGGGAFYLLAALGLGLFVAPVVELVLVASGVALLIRSRAARLGGGAEALAVSARRLLRPAALIALVSAAGLYAVELAVALPVGSGNTFDSSLLVTYTALLVQHGSIPLSFHPYATSAILYPQGTTVWLGGAQLTFGLPPARTPLLVTPLFLGIAPLSGYVFGRRLFGTETAGAAVALALAWLGPATRGLVGGSNDFAIAFPLVLLLAAESTVWFGPEPPRLGDALGFGLLVGYSAAINPVGAEWMMPALVLLAAISRPSFAGRGRRWLVRWASAVAVALAAISPTLYVLARGWSSPGFVPGSAAPPAPIRAGLSPTQLLGNVDPFLFRARDIALSPVPALRLELAVLLVLGLAAVLLPSGGSALARYLGPFRRWALAAGISIVGWSALLTASRLGVPGTGTFPALSSGAELSLWLYTVYGLVAAVPLVLALERLVGTERRGGAPPPARRPDARSLGGPPSIGRTLLPIALAFAIVVPGVVLTPVSLAPTLGTLYGDFGQVTPADFALLEYEGSHLPAGSRDLVAPGSFAMFLPGYERDVVLLYPLVPGFPWVNGSYRLVVSELTNGSLDASGRSALASLDAGFVSVTGNNTILWPAFSPTPLLADPVAFDELWHESDAYLFSVNQSAL